MEQKLAEFRARRRVENASKKEPCGIPEATTNTPADTSSTDTLPTDSQQEKTSTANIRTAAPKEDGSDWLLDSSLGRWLTSRQLVMSNVTLLKVLLWLVLLGLFAELEFGLPFFVLSLFYWLYEGLRSPAPRQPGELSAYSVFNPDCQPLLGAVTAEQLEREMGYRPLANT